MSATAMLVLVALALATWGLILSAVAGRFGLDRFCWGIVGAALGPLALVPFVAQVRASRRLEPPAEERPTRSEEREQLMLARGGRPR